MREPGPDPYRLLGISRDATATGITRAYRLRARAVHPDTAQPGAGTEAQFRAVSEAYQVLSDPARRAEYDRRSSRQVSPGPGHREAAPGRTRSRPAAGMPSACPRGPSGAGPAMMPALWAGPVRIEPLRATAPRSGPGTGGRTGIAGWAGLVRWYPGAGQDGPW